MSLGLLLGDWPTQSFPKNLIQSWQPNIVKSVVKNLIPIFVE
jgi:hypothetical protein